MTDIRPVAAERASPVAPPPPADLPPEAPPVEPPIRPHPARFSTLWEFALAVNRSEPAALPFAANGADAAVSIDEHELRKLLGTVWFRSVYARLSQHWRDRLLRVLADSITVPNHVVRVRRRGCQLNELSCDQLIDIAASMHLPERIRPDVQLLTAVALLWGQPGVDQLRFSDDSAQMDVSRFAPLFQLFRG